MVRPITRRTTMRRHHFLLLVGALGLAACGGPSSSAAFGDAIAGKAAYATTCTACHGANATGVVGLGKDLTTSEFLAGMSDEQVLEFLQVGRPASDPLNTTGVDMPPKGGNPALSEDDLRNIVAYLRTIHE
jgi:mono/diheme cytochrome c family protein